jgi:mono/diheme cytochrome c family protein
MWVADSSTEHIMIRMLGIAVIGIFFAAGASAQTAAQIEKGKQVYTAQKCQVCHSVGGVGNKRGALDEVGSKLSADQIRAWIVSAPEMTEKTKATRKPLMKAYTLPKEDLDALVAYMHSLKGKS